MSCVQVVKPPLVPSIAPIYRPFCLLNFPGRYSIFGTERSERRPILLPADPLAPGTVFLLVLLFAQMVNTTESQCCPAPLWSPFARPSARSDHPAANDLPSAERLLGRLLFALAFFETPQ